MSKVELFVWWLTAAEKQKLGEEPPAKLPEHVKAQYKLMSGRSGGIVLRAPELKLFTDDVGGLVTDMRVRIMVVRP